MKPTPLPRAFALLTLAPLLLAPLLLAAAHGDDPDLTPKPGVLAPRDLVQINVYDLVAPGQPAVLHAHLDLTGAVGLPLVGDVQLKGLTTDRAARAVADAYRAAKLIADPTVTTGILRRAADSKLIGDQIRPADGLRIRIWDLVAPGQPLTVLATVADDGTIDLPHAGPVKLESLTESKAAAEIARTYRDRKLIQNATLTVQRLEPDGN